MRKMLVLCVLVELLVLSCKSKNPSATTVADSKTPCENDSLHLVAFKDHSVQIGKYTWRNRLFVKSENAAYYYEYPDTNAEKLGFEIPNSFVDVYEYIDSTEKDPSKRWIKSIRPLERKITIGNREFISSAYETVYFRMQDLGTLEENAIKKTDMYESVAENYTDKNTALAKKRIDLQILDKAQFYDTYYVENVMRISYGWVYDAEDPTEKITLKLKEKDSSLVFQNHDGVEERTENRVYMGVLPGVNCYLVFVRYYEGHSFELYDFNTGLLKARIIGYPCFSPSLKRMVAFYDDPYGDGTGEMDIYSVSTTGAYKKTHSFKFVNWTPVEDPIEMVWLNDQEFKIKAKGIKKNFIEPNSGFFPENGYVKVKIH